MVAVMWRCMASTDVTEAAASRSSLQLAGSKTLDVRSSTAS